MLISCAAYQDGKKLGDVPVQQISDYVRRPECFVWVALKDATEEELANMQEEFGLHELAVEDARFGHQRPKIEEYGDSLFVVAHAIDMIDGELNVGEIDIFVDENFVLSVRNRSQQGFLGVRARCEREPELLKQGSSFVLYALMDAVVDRYFPILEAFESELEEVEDRIFDKGSERANIEKLYQLKRKVTILKHAVTPLMESVSKLHGGRVPRICNNMQDYFRDIYDHLYRLNVSIDAMRDTIGTAIQVNLSMVAIDESEVNKRLAAWAAIFAIASAFFSLWGMNFDLMPELKWKYGYPAAIALVATVCGYMYYRFKKSKWL
jgi:magnesium transporter